ncbi:MAG: glycosyltransferase family 2 protein [Thermomicrobiales bacterium]|jgi:putative flippase GtrA|nr:glycosyltransferase family 2 protein [Thermomicrobiales bacterium]MCD6056885.1 glycosyltransferase family 2 protein [Thermomicrobiales bacterium]MDF2731364.1 glycosyltransferase family 2 protein [Acidimicrobiia bacterium]MDF2759004.1 glycosyltransferase family 2 protein [Thermomicrobiales bacterium]MDF3018059.1 glycosyltransferase family 2 protein [Thermomicrobiales bacterium]
MLSSEGLPRPVIRPAAITRRFQKFLLVGAVGLGVNQGVLFALVDQANLAVAMASPIAILLSMIVTFILNERWTWHDRGQGRILHRAMLYGSINSGGLLINWLTLVSLHQTGLDYLVANLVGAGIAAVWNFSLNHALTWRR